MNRKKFISAFLIGLVTVASVGSLESCKDYDDDIKDLQEQINGNEEDVKAQIATLQSALDDCKAACETAQAELEQAIKDATNDAEGFATIQAAEAKEAAIEAAQALIEQAISDLENGAVAAAQSRADAAYALAEQVNTLANNNSKDIKNLSEKLDTVNTNLKSLIDGLRSDLTTTQSKLDEVEAQANKNATDLITLETALNSLKESNEEAHKALSEKDDELAALIEKNQKEITELLDTKVKELNEAIATAKKELTEAYQAADKALQEGYEKADEELDQKITTLSGTVTEQGNSISTLQSDVKSINSYLSILEGNINNLITGLILQDEQLEIVQAQVVSDVNKTGLSGKTFSETRNGNTYIYFPYKGAKNADGTTLIVGQWNVERVAGPVYYTITPTSVNFTDKANISLENSLENAPQGISISEPTASERKSPITRAEGAPANGLYQSTITNSRTHLSSAHPGFSGSNGNSYALFTRYQQTSQDGTVQEKKVYSQYALNLIVSTAEAQTSPVISPVDADISHPSSCDARFTVSYDETMQGNFNLLPQNTEFGKSAAGNAKVYRKYVEAIAVKNARNEVQSGTTLTNLLNAIDNDNSGILNTIFEEDTEGFDNITITIPDASGSYSFIGSTVTFRYYIQNYDGTIYSTDINVMFAKDLFKEAEVTIEHTPYQAGTNTTLNGLTRTDKTDFQTEANCITVSASNKLWYTNTASIKIEAKDNNGVVCKLQTVEFYSDNRTTSPYWIGETPIATVNLNGTSEATVSGLTLADLQKIKNMIITYDPADLEVEKTYTLIMTSYDLNGNRVSELPIKFTMKYPTHHIGLINPNPAFFTPYDKNMTREDLTTDKTLTAWANQKGNEEGTSGIYEANYNVIAAFNAPYYASDGCVLRFDYTDHKDYDLTNSVYKLYKPTSTVPFKYVTSAADYIMSVPSLALKYGAEHAYTMQIAVEYFGVTSLWYNPYSFKMVYKSAIAYADFKFDKSLYEVGYPSETITLTDENITSDDPSTSAADDITYFGSSRDDRIKSTSVRLKDTQFASLFKSIDVTDAGIVIVTNENVPGGVGAITTDAVAFEFLVEDYYNNTTIYTFNIKVKENQQ